MAPKELVQGACPAIVEQWLPRRAVDPVTAVRGPAACPMLYRVQRIAACQRIVSSEAANVPGILGFVLLSPIAAAPGIDPSNRQRGVNSGGEATALEQGGRVGTCGSDRRVAPVEWLAEAVVAPMLMLSWR